MTFITVPAITIRPHDGGCLVWGAQAKPASLCYHFIHRLIAGRLHRLFDDRHQFALQRPVIPRRPFAKPLDYIVAERRPVKGRP
jgi:hypothetical protein